MNGKFLLDTNIIIALFAQEMVIKAFLITAKEVFVPAIVIGELYYGARNSGRIEENVKRIDQFAAANEILFCDAKTAQYYGLIKQKLRQKGQPIPDNDIWIAAIALQYELTLVSRDQHFSKIEGYN
ncbi:MAG: VapC toxin family PIN domain ribonuclease [Candidatus Parabeggiatoa sp. nov. 3]|nr:MAG: VapC toxin family PIN domain ribonuclease [Gammaproteobacteria bacterium]RKZ66245.1 MAG: VapC toxin family PIN domain ribonuclease [Gammaproteobacteria bacterium]RKZ90158.1 MAG: VapC toxin family PIN domain ribonuclease [Gammaproteobacteria bacterium]